MFTRMKLYVVAFCLILVSSPASSSDSACSPFHYEEQTLEKMIRMEIRVEKMKAELDETKQQLTEALETFKNMDLANMEKQTTEAMGKNSAQMESIPVPGSALDTFIAFKAQRVTDQSLGDNKIVKFEDTVIDIGDSYSSETGMFVAPVKGVYQFSTQICIDYGNFASFGIYLEDNPIASNVQGDSSFVNCAFIYAITGVDKGARLSVRCSSSCSSRESLWGKNYSLNSFSGNLLRVL